MKKLSAIKISKKTVIGTGVAVLVLGFGTAVMLFIQGLGSLSSPAGMPHMSAPVPSVSAPATAPQEVWDAPGRDSFFTGDFAAESAYWAEMPAVTPSPHPDASGLPADFQGERRIIRTADINLETTDMTDTRSQLRQLVEDMGGFIEQASLRQAPAHSMTERDYTLHGTYVLRVPVAQFDRVSELIGQLGLVTHQSLSSRDVTAQFYDTQRRLTLREQEYTRLTHMREHAANLEEILDLEHRISQARLAVERYSRQAQAIDHAAAFATITVHLYGWGESPVPLPEPVDSFFTRLSDGLADSIDFTVSVVQWVVIVLVSLIVPVGALAVPVLFFGGMIHLRRKRQIG